MPDRSPLIVISERTISTPRLRLRPWTSEDAGAALQVFGTDQVARWLAPAMDRVPDADAMHDLLDKWTDHATDHATDETGDVTTGDSAAGDGRPTGRWAIEDAASGTLIGAAAILPLPPHGEDLEIGWQLTPQAWGHGYATEAGRALAHFAFSGGEDEVFAVVRPRNTKGMATAQRVGMEWVGETDKYYDLRLQVYRLRKGELSTVTR